MRGGLVLGVLLGAVAGLGGGWWLWGRCPPDPGAYGLEERSVPSTQAPAALDVATGVTSRPGSSAAPGLTLAPGAATAPPAASPPALLDADPAFVEQRVREVATAIRRQGEAAIASAEMAARMQVQKQLEAERAARVDLARGGTMAFLKEKAKGGPHFELVSDARAYGRMFHRKAAGARVEGTSLQSDTTLADGDRVVFPPGRFALDLRPWQNRPFPADIVIEGDAMDQTLLTLSDELRMSGDVHSLTFRDLTLHCGDNYLESMRGGAYTLRLERCRIIGFDMGAGGSDMLSGSVGAFFASECKIEACFGRAPGFGNLFDVRGGLLARLEDCEIVGPFRSVWYAWSGATHVFERCRFREMDAAQYRASSEQPPENVRLVDCSWEFRAPDAPSPQKRTVSEINPAWAEPGR